jgi:hypothetical protein
MTTMISFFERGAIHNSENVCTTLQKPQKSQKENLRVVDAMKERLWEGYELGTLLYPPMYMAFFFDLPAHVHHPARHHNEVIAFTFLLLQRYLTQNPTNAMVCCLMKNELLKAIK